MFHNEAGLLFDKIYKNQIQIHTLESLRDILLPKLMSGEIRVALMKYDPKIHHRRSIRLKHYDYTQAGFVFCDHRNAKP